MLGFFGSIEVAHRSLQVQRKGAEVTGHNLANVNNPAYARQRLEMAASLALSSPAGEFGTGVDAVTISQLRDALVDEQINAEVSVRGSLEAQQRALDFAQAGLAQSIDRQARGSEGMSSASGVGGQQGLAEQMTDFFSAWQSLSTNPTSLTERNLVLNQAENLANQFQQVDGRVEDLRVSLNKEVQNDVAKANELLEEVARLNGQVSNAEARGTGTANDLRDQRQQKLEELSELVKVQVTAGENSMLNVSINGTDLVTGKVQAGRLEAFDSGTGNLHVRIEGQAEAVLVTGGRLHGHMEVRDGTLAALGQELDQLAAALGTAVNSVHANGYDLNGGTGLNFFTGSTAGTIQVNGQIRTDPARIQASGTAGAVGDSQVAVQLAQLWEVAQGDLSGRTLGQFHSETVASVGQSLAKVNDQLANQEVVEQMLKRQRDSVSGVSMDEEMTNLLKFQRAFEASAKLLKTVDEMIATVLNMKS